MNLRVVRKCLFWVELRGASWHLTFLMQIYDVMCFFSLFRLICTLFNMKCENTENTENCDEKNSSEMSDFIILSDEFNFNIRFNRVSSKMKRNESFPFHKSQLNLTFKTTKLDCRLSNAVFVSVSCRDMMNPQHFQFSSVIFFTFTFDFTAIWISRRWRESPNSCRAHTKQYFFVFLSLSYFFFVVFEMCKIVKWRN